MLRLVLFLFLIAGVALAFASVMAALRAAAPNVPSTETSMPRPFRLIAFVLLFVLMTGLATGWLGAA
ncbi:hypothetical protein EU805_11780 [Salipiger sp. IMCC34102]|uniref:hypothetical protein n=1 Tax=Salipiger sp. IMCC34102 TaxID=2510647 RepID=UPI00101D4496|nr:hypothetical protein [Salipiger sp. IMCC34102]RYH01863.1 hypothetical protein EU805_11780 [Salipiger sp. IMCC34102]